MNKYALGLTVFIVIALSVPTNRPEANVAANLQNDNPVEIYALLFDQFPKEIDNITVCSSLEIKASLVDLGWQEENISVFLGEENLSKSIIENQLNYLEQNVDENDLVFIYFTAHGHTYCRDVLDFNSWFQAEFSEINTNNKIFLMESCYGGEFVKLFPSRSYAMSSVGENEVAIAFLPGENSTWVLSEPEFAGGISSHFWAKAMNNTDADLSLDGVVTMDEIYEYSLPFIRECYNETFEAYPLTADYVLGVAGYTDNYPMPKVVDRIPFKTTLNATDFILNNEKYIWDEDAFPTIDCQDIVYFTELDTILDISFLILERTDFSYYCYVNDSLKEWRNSDGSSVDALNYTYSLILKPCENYNVCISVTNEWGNENTKYTLVLFQGEIDNKKHLSAIIGSVIGGAAGVWIIGVLTIRMIRTKK